MRKFIDVRSGIDERDYTTKTVGLIAPEEVFDEEYVTPFKVKVLNQMFSSQCVSHALATTMAYCEKKLGFEPNDYSRGFTYMMEKKSRDDGPGTNTRELLSCANKYGNVSWDDYMFGNNDCYSLWNSYKEIEETLKLKADHKITKYFKLRSPEDIKNAVYFTGACIFNYPIYKGYNSFKKVLDVPSDDAKISGYHSVTCIGWNKTGWVCQDSYGILHGRFTIPYDYCEFSQLECWGIFVSTIESHYKVNRFTRALKCIPYFFVYVKNQFVDWFHKK